MGDHHSTTAAEQSHSGGAADSTLLPHVWMELMFWQEHMWNEAASRQLEAELSTDDYVAVPASKGGVHVKHAAFRVSSPRSPIVRKAATKKGREGRSSRSMTPRTR